MLFGRFMGGLCSVRFEFVLNERRKSVRRIPVQTSADKKVLPMPVDHICLSELDSLRVLELLENPPAPNAKLLAAARRLPTLKGSIQK